jgi:hypothetical protein
MTYFFDGDETEVEVPAEEVEGEEGDEVTEEVADDEEEEAAE